ncbi:hypothetical protein BO78DRAFT_433702 [Aspergillus sclerotiicarbonarius CBS 121057]|uniref:Uncharacterized protein n=1 Tax=Aspergillus sclerotiicarbonarius (strain CBS 121057 / IBT 28362) TaxID=1448318 RepID=A0A319F7F3_ASPSB|nr:hypothetical protein BO78DRAFT_433702 [Aspergillus sclerotiicarbonarius CBS 121057]
MEYAPRKSETKGLGQKIDRSQDSRRLISTEYLDNSSSDLEVIRHHRRPRANTSTQRDTTPPRHDYGLVIGQRLLEKNDDEDEISERLRRLEKFEKKVRQEEAERRTEEQHKLQMFEEAELSAKREREVKAALREKKLEMLEKETAEKERREQIRKELGDEEARRRLEEHERTNQENKIRLAAVEEYKLAEERRVLEEERRKRQLEKEVRAAIEAELGYTLEQVKAILTRMATKKTPKHRRGRTRTLSTTDHGLPSGDEADMEAP